MATKTLLKVDKLLDTLAVLRDEQAQADAAAAAAKKACSDIEEQLLAALIDSGLETTGNANLIASVKRSEVPSIEDSAAFDAFVLKHKALDLYQRRLSTTAWRERQQAGIIVDGITVKPVVALSVRSRDGRTKK